MRPATQLSFDTISKDKVSAYLLSSKAKQEMVELCCRLTQILGLPRSTGQIFGLLYFSSSPLSLGQVCEMLGISKASASTGTRQLATWGALRKVWIPGERKDYYEALSDFGQLLRGGYGTIVKPRMSSSIIRLKKIEDSLNDDLKSNIITTEDHKFIKSRLDKIKKGHNKLIRFAPIIEKMIGL